MDRKPSGATAAPATARRSLKRKFDQDFEESQDVFDRKVSSFGETDDRRRGFFADVQSHLGILDSSADRAAAKGAAQALCELIKNDFAEETVDEIVNCGAVPVLVKRLIAPVADGGDAVIAFEHEVEKGCAFALGLLAMKPEHQHLIVDAGALSHLVDLLKRHKNSAGSRALSGVLRKAADAITNLAHENSSIKTRVRFEDGILPLVELLDYLDVKVQRAAAAALRTLAFKNDKNKNQIIECNALPTLVLMLHSEDAAVHYEAVGVIGNLVHSSPDIKKDVLQAGALQPIIGLLRSCCPDSQREAALLLGQFAASESDCKVYIVQRGAIAPLLELLQSSDSHLQEMAAFAIGRLAQDTHNQAGIAHNGGIVPLIKLLDTKNGSLQHNAAFALYGMADNEDNVAEFIKVGGVQKLLDGEFVVQPTKDCVAKTLKRLEEKINGRVLNHLLYLMRVGDRTVQRRMALALAHLCSPGDQKIIFIDNGGLDLLIQILELSNHKNRRKGSMAMHKLATKATSVPPIEAAPPLSTPKVYLGEKYVNDSTLSDITFLIEGKRFYAHRICLLASSEAFRAMFDSGYRESNAKVVEIPNVRWDVFELMMRYIYTGSVKVDLDIAQDVLRAADQYLLEGLKRLCEHTIAKDISTENVSFMYEFSEAFNATSLRQACILFILEQFDELNTMPWYSRLIQQVVPEIRRLFTNALTRPIQPAS